MMVWYNPHDFVLRLTLLFSSHEYFGILCLRCTYTVPYTYPVPVYVIFRGFLVVHSTLTVTQIHDGNLLLCVFFKSGALDIWRAGKQSKYGFCSTSYLIVQEDSAAVTVAWLWLFHICFFWLRFLHLTHWQPKHYIGICLWCLSLFPPIQITPLPK